MSDSQPQSQTSTSDSQPQYNLVVLISGNGSNLQALIDACASGALPNTRVTHVISNRKNAYGLQRAALANPPIPTTYHNLVPYRKQHPATEEGLQSARAAYDADLARLILALPPDQFPHVIVCAGWMHILSPSFLDPLTQASSPSQNPNGTPIKIINLHPALPGEFAGANAILRAWEAGQRGEIKRTGVMVHEVVSEVDAGRDIVTQEVEIREGENLEGLEGRMHGVEHGLIVEGTRRALGEIQAGGKA